MRFRQRRHNEQKQICESRLGPNLSACSWVSSRYSGFTRNQNMPTWLILQSVPLTKALSCKSGVGPQGAVCCLPTAPSGWVKGREPVSCCTLCNFMELIKTLLLQMDRILEFTFTQLLEIRSSVGLNMCFVQYSAVVCSIYVHTVLLLTIQYLNISQYYLPCSYSVALGTYLTLQSLMHIFLYHILISFYSLLFLIAFSTSQ